MFPQTADLPLPASAALAPIVLIAAFDRVGLALGEPANWVILLAAGPIHSALDPIRRSS